MLGLCMGIYTLRLQMSAMSPQMKQQNSMVRTENTRQLSGLLSVQANVWTVGGACTTFKDKDLEYNEVISVASVHATKECTKYVFLKVS